MHFHSEYTDDNEFDYDSYDERGTTEDEETEEDDDEYSFSDEEFEEDTVGIGAVSNSGGGYLEDLSEYDPEDEDDRQDQDFEDIDDIDDLLDYDEEVEKLLEDDDEDIPKEDLTLGENLEEEVEEEDEEDVEEVDEEES